MNTSLPLTSHSTSALLCVGVITAAHGVKGYVKVKSFLEDSRQMPTYNPFCDESGEPHYEIQRIIKADGENLIAVFEGVHDRDQAENLRGTKLLIPRERLPKLKDKDEFYHADLKGLRVLTSEGKVVGEIQGIHNFGAGDLLEIVRSNGEALFFPFTKEGIEKIALQERVIYINSEIFESFFQGKDGQKCH